MWLCLHLGAQVKIQNCTGVLPAGVNLSLSCTIFKLQIVAIVPEYYIHKENFQDVQIFMVFMDQFINMDFHRYFNLGMLLKVSTTELLVDGSFTVELHNI